ncbi:MAG: NYN domain-containing protein [Ignavibacteria bacterium]|nr:NYN domain-containing protein [Ignavibacteria bacterium]
MNKIIFFIDGFNLYHALLNNPAYNKYKWLNYYRLAQCYIAKKDDLIDVYWFTALAIWNKDKVKRHKIYIKALENAGVKIVRGEFKKKTRKCRICHKSYSSYEEKQTDVNMALYLFKLAIQDKFDKAFLISGDSDLIPSIKTVKETFPDKQITVILPLGGRSESLKQSADSYMKMKEKHLQSSQFPETIIMKNGEIITKPKEWE